MSFQWIFDNAGSLTIDKQPTVAQTITRNNRVNAVVRSGYTYRFTVGMPTGYKYSLARKYITEYEQLGRYTTDTVSIPQDYISGYKGDLTTVSLSGSHTQYESTITLNNTPTPTAGQTVVAAGDLIKIGSGNTYTVVEDLIHPNTSATLNRAILETTGTNSITTGSSVDWDIICVSMPNWNIFDYNLVNWDGNFVFYEVPR